MNKSDQQTAKNADVIGVIGGSGFESFPELEVLQREKIITPFGKPSDDVVLGRYQGRDVAFVPRHGSGHSLLPHLVPYRANIAALKSVGVSRIIATCIAGSLRADIAPGSFVVPDQFIDFTWGRQVDIHSDVPMHLGMAEPYCASTRQLLISVGQRVAETLVPSGTVAVIQGPRFSTRAESRRLISSGCDVVNMTQYPESYCAKKMGICYGALAGITDYDVGVPSSQSIEIGHIDRVLDVFRILLAKTRQIVLGAIEADPLTARCSCATEVLEEYYKRT